MWLRSDEQVPGLQRRRLFGEARSAPNDKPRGESSRKSPGIWEPFMKVFCYNHPFGTFTPESP